MKYNELVKEIKLLANGNCPRDMERILWSIASTLKKEYGIEPLDIVAAIYMFDNGKSNYGLKFLRRAYRDLVKIGRDKGWL